MLRFNLSLVCFQFLKQFHNIENWKFLNSRVNLSDSREFSNNLPISVYNLLNMWLMSDVQESLLKTRAVEFSVVSAIRKLPTQVKNLLTHKKRLILSKFHTNLILKLVSVLPRSLDISTPRMLVNKIWEISLLFCRQNASVLDRLNYFKDSSFRQEASPSSD